MWLKLFVHPTSTMRSLANPPIPFSSFSPCVHCTPVHSAYPHSPVGRAGLLHQGSVSEPQSREGSALQQCWPGAHGCPAACGACSSAPEPYAAERAGLGLHGKVVDSVKRSLVAHESANVYLRQVRRCVCSCNWNQSFSILHNSLGGLASFISVIFFLSSLMVCFCCWITWECLSLTHTAPMSCRVEPPPCCRDVY